MQRLSHLLFFIFCTASLFGQNVGIGTATPHSSAALDITSNNKGILIPRLTQSQRNAIETPVTGLLVYQVDMDSSFFWYNGAAWIKLLSSKSGWELTGNATTSENNFIGTTDNRNIIFKRNNIKSGWIDTTNTSFGIAGLSSITSAKYNTAFGGYALFSNNFGDANSAFGYGALSANVGGIRNTAVGVNALASSGAASDNTAVGTSSMTNNSTGIVNTAIGVQSLFSNTTGSGNTASGYNALYTNNTGIGNTANGFYSLVSNTTGNNNTATGMDALNANVTGNSNTAHGVQSLFSTNTGNFNTAVGVNAGQTNTMGDSNTVIGYNADVGYNNLTNVTAIGAGAKAYLNNTMILGNNVSVGIGTSFPVSSAQLQITSNNKGILIPTMSSGNRLAISNPANGLLVYDEETYSFWYYNLPNHRWVNMVPQTMQNNVVQKTLPGGAANDKYGYAVSAGNNVCIIGAPGRASNRGSVFVGVNQSGNVYAYTESTGSGYVANDQFGYAVAINKDFGNRDWIAGAPFDDNTLTDQGSVYISTFQGDSKLYSPQVQANEVFGAALDIAGHSFANDLYFIVGAPGRTGGTGAAYIFWYNGITTVLMQTINPVAPNPTDSFGHAVSLSYNYTTGEGWAFVGAPNDDMFAVNDGSVSVYKRNLVTGSWEFQFRMSSANPVTDGHFGFSVSSNMLCNSGVAIGEPGYTYSVMQPNKGRLQYSFYNGSSFQTPVIVDSGQYSNNYLGNAVAVVSNQSCNKSFLVAGSKSGPIGLTVSNWGIAKYYFRLNNTGSWIPNGKTFDVEGDNGWQFGFSVGVSRYGNVLIGSPAAAIGNNLSQGKIQVEIFPDY